MNESRPPVDNDQHAAHEWLMAKYEEARRRGEPPSRVSWHVWRYFVGGHRNYEGER